MSVSGIAVVAVGFLAFAMMAKKLDGTMLTPPLIFIVFGLLLGQSGAGLLIIGSEHMLLHGLAEFTLIMVLVSDASRIDLKRLSRDHSLPLRMLVIGLPLTMILGAALAHWIFPGLLFWEAALLAALLAPTDAALGQAVVSAKIVPVRIRQAINVESGLNDGIALPAVLLLAALSSPETGHGAGHWIKFALFQVVLGPVVGIVLGYLAARMLDLATEKDWADAASQGVGVMAFAILTYSTAELVGGNGFIAAFIGGMVLGNTLKHSCKFLFEFMETEGQILMLVTFLVFGATLLPEAVSGWSPRVLIYALLSLTVIRMLPIAISLARSKLRAPTILFLGWFGPRGLASILFGLLIVEESQAPNRESILSITLITVGISALLHGLTAAPFARLYGGMTESLGECPETKPVAEQPLRMGV